LDLTEDGDSSPVLSIFKRGQMERRSKILIVGSSGVGKTSLRHRYIKGNFRNEELMTIGMEFDSTDLEINGTTLKLEIYDFAGQEAFQIQKKLLKNVQGVIIVCDLTRQETLFSVRSWVDKLFELSPKLRAPFIVAGNKTDLEFERQVSADDVLQMISAILEDRDVTTRSMEFMETSAKSGRNISAMFETLGREILEEYYP
jgi:small GTP-binding protein